MKKNVSIILVIVILVAVCGFAFYASGNEIAYFKNYTTNFKNNINGLALFFGWDLPEPVRAFLDRIPVSEPNPEEFVYVEPTPEPIDEDLFDEQTETKNPAKSVVPMALTYADSAQYAHFGDNILCATETTLTAYNKKGAVQWAESIQIADPILATAGNYILLAERGGTRLEVFKKDVRIFQTQIDSAISGASISEDGDTVLVTEKNSYKGSCIVFNKKGQEVYRWNSGSYSILSAAISSGSRRLAIALLNTDEGAASKLQFFKLNETQSYKTLDFDDTIIFDLRFFGDTLNAIADNKLIGISTKGKIQWTTEFGEKALTHYAMNDDGDKLCVFDNANAAELTRINKSGRSRSTAKSEVLPDLVDIHNGYMAYNNGRDVIFATLSGKIQSRYMCARDIQKLYVLDSSHVLVVYSSSIEFVELSKG